MTSQPFYSNSLSEQQDHTYAIFLLLEAARSDRQISLMWKNLAYEIVHRNTIVLQFN